MLKRLFTAPNKTDKRIIGNIPLFVISMALSVILWYVIVTTEDTSVTFTTSAIKPYVSGVQYLRNAGYTVADYGELPEESIKVSGKRSDLITAMDNITVEYDLSNISSAGKVTIIPIVNGASDLRIIKNNFSAITFDVQKIDSNNNTKSTKEK